MEAKENFFNRFVKNVGGSIVTVFVCGCIFFAFAAVDGATYVELVQAYNAFAQPFSVSIFGGGVLLLAFLAALCD